MEYHAYRGKNFHHFKDLIKGNKAKAGLLKITGKFPVANLGINVIPLDNSEYEKLFDDIGIENLIYLQNKMRDFDRYWVMFNSQNFEPYESLDGRFLGKFSQQIAGCLDVKNCSDIRQIDFYQGIYDIQNAKKFIFSKEPELTKCIGVTSIDFDGKKVFLNSIENKVYFEGKNPTNKSITDDIKSFISKINLASDL